MTDLLLFCALALDDHALQISFYCTVSDAESLIRDLWGHYRGNFGTAAALDRILPQEQQTESYHGFACSRCRVKLQAFVFNWPGSKQHAAELELLLDPYCEVAIINSDDAMRDVHRDWYHIGEDAFFSAQWNKAVELFHGDILFHIQADAWPHNVDSMLDECVRYIRDRNVGVYGPNIDFTDLEFRRNALPRLDDNVYEVPATDETCWAISAEVLKAMPLADPAVSRLGWGMDFVASATARSMSRKVVRDYRFCVDHPKGRGYNEPQAREQWKRYKLGLEPDLRQTIEALERDVLRLMPGRVERMRRRLQRARRVCAQWFFRSEVRNTV
jgi:hypothetical protein